MSLNRYNPKRDENEAEIIQALEAMGCQVYRLNRPSDLVVNFRGREYLLEVKMPNGRLTLGQEYFHREWRVKIPILKTVEEAIQWVQSL